LRGECSENSRAQPNLFGLTAVILIAQTPSEILIYECFRFIFNYIVKYIFFDNVIQGLHRDFMVANNLCKIKFINIRN